MSGKKAFLRSTARLFAVFAALVLFLGSENITAYALSENYVIDEYHEWYDIEDCTLFYENEYGFNGTLKTAADPDDGSYYVYFHFTDANIDKNGDNDSIALVFTVQNSERSYTFSVNRNGFVNTGGDEQNSIKLEYNFDKCSCARRGGEILVGFELKNKTDRTLTNYISCEYTAGNGYTAELFGNEALDMYVEPTTKAAKTTKSSSKSSKTKSTKASTTKSAKSSTTKSKSSKSAGSTKYSATGASKYTPTGIDENYEQWNDDYTAETDTDGDSAAYQTYGEGERTTLAKLLIITAVIFAAVGVALLIVATILAISKRRKKDCEKDVEKLPADDSEYEDDTDEDSEE